MSPVIALSRGRAGSVLLAALSLLLAGCGKDKELAALINASNAVFATFAKEDRNVQATLHLLPGALTKTRSGLGKLATAASLLFGFAPHLGAEVYERLTGARVWEQPWPQADPAMLVAETFELVCMVNGKVRDRITAPSGAGREELERIALASRGVASHVDGHPVARVIVVPDKLVNVVVR